MPWPFNLSKPFRLYVSWDEEGFYSIVKFFWIKIKSIWKCHWKDVIEIAIEDNQHDLSIRLKTNGGKQIYLPESIYGKLDSFVEELQKKFPGFTKDNCLGTTDEWVDIYLCWKANDDAFSK